MKQIIGLFISCVLLVSCASNSPVDLHYYLLDSSINASATKQELNENSPLVIIENIKISEYLQQSSLSMVTAQHQIHHAANHLWAEPLSDAIVKALLSDLRGISDNHRFEEIANRWQGKARYQIAIQIDRFHPITQQNVILAGRFWITDLIEDKTQANDFYFSKQLSEPGYAYSVEQQRQLITELAQNIIDSIPLHKK
jgi:uncharacterized lipoprotein YmbA